MTTAPSTSTSSSAPVTSELSKISAYLHAHERLIVLILCLAVGINFYSKVIDLIAKHDKTKDDASNAALVAAQKQTDQLGQAAQQALLQYQQLVTSLQKENAALQAQQASRDQQTTVQQTKDRQMAPPELASRWAQLTGVTASDILANANGFLVAQGAAQQTVVQLEEVPKLQGDLKDEQQITSNLSTQIANLSGVNNDLNKQVAGLKDLNAKQVKACEDDKALLRANARKGKLKIAAIAYGAGLATRGFIKIFTGI